ncbi:TPA: hypothetical protein ACH3X3_011090 [Trebouxia sp. C0006]
MPCMHMQSALARQMPGCSTTGRSNTQLQNSRLSHRAFQPQAARPFTTSSYTSSCTAQRGSRCLRGRSLSAGRVYAASASQEEADLRADYGALSERLESLADEVHDLLQGNSLYLVGMMGSGKSTVGRLVGKAMKYPLLDTDALIEQSSKVTVSKIFADEGEEAFRDLETEVLHQLMPFTKCIIATGGGAVIRRKNWGFMQHGVVIWLDGSPELLASHVLGQSGGTKSRPLIFSNTDVQEQASQPPEAGESDEYKQTVEKLRGILEDRQGKYSFADIRVPLQSEEHGSLAAEAVVVAYRILKAVKDRLHSSAAERQAKIKFKIEGANDVPKTMQVKQSPVSANGHE